MKVRCLRRCSLLPHKREPERTAVPGGRESPSGAFTPQTGLRSKCRVFSAARSQRFRRAGSDGLRHPASASCLGRHLRLAGRCPNNSSLFPPLAAVAVVALRGGWSPEVGRGGLGTPLPASGPAERPCTLKVGRNFPREAERIQNRPLAHKRQHPRHCKSSAGGVFFRL